MRIIHLFKWKLKDIDIKAIHNQGFDAIQINPIQPTKDMESDDWWIYYQPISFSIGNNLGSKEDLINLCKKAKEYNIKIIADVVLNHVAGKDNGEIYPHYKVDKNLKDNIYFWKSFNKAYNWNDRYEVTNYSIGVPSLNLANYDLQDIIIRFLNELIECGVGGFRFDAAKHISLPEEDGNMFWIRVLESLNKKDLFNYAEVIFENQSLVDSYCKYINVLTSSYGSRKDKLVTFCDSHDLEKEFKFTEKMSDEIIINEYDILCRQYQNTIFYVREFNSTWRDKRIKCSNYYKEEMNVE